MVDIWGSNSFHVNKKTILVASTDVVVDCNDGTIPIADLAEIWMYDEQTQTWNNRIDELKCYILKNNKKNLINYSLT